MLLKDIVQYLDEYFALSSFPKIDISQNGLQVESGTKVNKIVTAVDACLESFEAAAAEKADLLIVHHGLFWGRSMMVTGSHGKRIACLIRNGISLYAMHLPLDMDQERGNNACLANLLGLETIGPFGNYRGCKIGVAAKSRRVISRKKFAEKVEQVLTTRVQMLEFGPEKIKRIAIASGGGSCEIEIAGEEGFDLLLTGEGGHIAYHQAKEAGINVMYAGHYATETVGVKAIGQHLQEKYGLEHTFVDIPTGY